MRTRGRLLLFAALLSAVAASTFYFSHVLRRAGAGPIDAHYWIHNQLNITPAQHKSLLPMEEKFGRRRDELVALIRQAERELAEAILTDKSDSVRVKTAVQKIHRAQGELQQAVLDHVFDMSTVLTDEQYDRLLEFTAHTLSDDSGTVATSRTSVTHGHPTDRP